MPLATTVKTPLTVEAPKLRSVLLFKVALWFDPVVVSVTAPVKTLFKFRLIEFAPALNDDVPGMVRIPVSLIDPFVVTERVFPLDNVIAGSDTPALDKLMIKLALPVIPPPNVTTPEPEPPMVEFDDKLIAEFTVILLPLNVREPFPEPEPFNAIELVFTNVALLKLMSNMALLATVMDELLPKEFSFPIVRVPELMLVVPE